MSSAASGSAGPITSRAPQWWLRLWPQVRRISACVDKHANLFAWPHACDAVLQSSGLPRELPFPVVQHWDALSAKVEASSSFPDVVLITPRATCDCGRALTEDPRHAARNIERANITLLTRDGFKTAVNYAVHCRFCHWAYYAYYRQRRPPDKPCAHKTEPWEFDDHGLGSPAALMVSSSTAVSWDLADALDVRMLRCPFTWRQLGREYRQLH